MTLSDTQRESLVKAMQHYDTPAGQTYDQIFYEVHERIVQAGDAGKVDIAAITFWKRSGQGAWIGRLLQVHEAEVRAATREAFIAEDDSGALRALAGLPGFKRQEAISTALLCAFDPVRYAVMDRRALKALDDLGLGVGSSRGMTVRYLEAVRAVRDDVCAQRPATTARDIDKALYVLGG